MAESRHPSRIAGRVPRKLPAPPALCGFVLLLALLFSVSYAVGAAAGPVAPGMHGTGPRTGGDPGGGGGTGDMPGMHGGGE
jgi:anti-sigma factor RsiW